METTLTYLLLDAVLIVTLIVLAWRALASTDLFTGIILFIGFGLLMALVWVRLHAPDIALAEAAIGAGLTGALLLNAYAKRRKTEHNSGDNNEPHEKIVYGRSSGVLALVLGLLILLPLIWAVASLPDISDGLRNAVANNINQSGVSNPVTAVLLNFRGYDTLLEIAVLMLAMMAVWVVNGQAKLIVKPPQLELAALWGLTSMLTPMLILTAGYLLWIGSSRPGGAFQAGALLGGAAVILIVSGYRFSSVTSRLMRWIASMALLTFIAVGILVLSYGNFLQYPPQWAGTLILTIETAATVSIGAILAALFLGHEPHAGVANPMATPAAEEKQS
jgi:multisubunit Na+/H+ antiporter MnhB subunit